MTDFGFCGDAYASRSIYQSDQECINFYPEIDQRKADGDRGKITLYPTPGIDFCTYTVGEGAVAATDVRALYTLSNGSKMISVTGNAVCIHSGTATNLTSTKIGTLNTSQGNVWITDNGQGVYIVDGGSRYTYNLSTGVFATVSLTDGAFSGGISCQVVDNFIIYAQRSSRNWAATSPSSPVTTALSVGQKLGGPDNIVALFVSNRDVFLLGQSSSEAWIDTGSFPFPFSIIPGTTFQHGCAAPLSVARTGNTFSFLSTDTRGSNVFVRMNGYATEVFSTLAVSNDLQGQVISDARSFTYIMFGHEFYVTIFPTANKTWVYDVSTQMWHKWLSTNEKGEYTRTNANCGAFYNGNYYVGLAGAGIIGMLNPKTYLDLSFRYFGPYSIGAKQKPIVRLRRCPHLTEELNRVFYDDFQIQFQPGCGSFDVFPIGSEELTGDAQAMLRWSNDGGSTWSAERWSTIGKTGQYKYRARWQQMGQARDRIFEVRCSSPVFWAIISSDLTATPSDY